MTLLWKSWHKKKKAPKWTWIRLWVGSHSRRKNKAIICNNNKKKRTKNKNKTPHFIFNNKTNSSYAGESSLVVPIWNWFGSSFHFRAYSEPPDCENDSIYKIHLMKEINWVFKMEERGKVECSIHPAISQRSRENGTPWCQEHEWILQRNTTKQNTAYYVSQTSAAIENRDIWAVGEVFKLYTTPRCVLRLLWFPIILLVKKEVTGKEKQNKTPSEITISGL